MYKDIQITRKKGEKMFEIWFYETGKTVRWTLEQCEAHFGKNEWPEYLAGCFTNVVAVEL